MKKGIRVLTSNSSFGILFSLNTNILEKDMNPSLPKGQLKDYILLLVQCNTVCSVAYYWERKWILSNNSIVSRNTIKNTERYLTNLKDHGRIFEHDVVMENCQTRLTRKSTMTPVNNIFPAFLNKQSSWMGSQIFYYIFWCFSNDWSP